MMVKLTDVEVRIIGSLIEKSITTPDLYPMSLNALTNACNQKSNRDPVMALSELDVQQGLDELNEKRLVLSVSSGNTRVAKFQHRFCNTEFSDLQFNEQELAVVCLLMLRGAQTPGELRSRSNRLCSFSNVAETESVLQKLASDGEGPFVARLPRQPGRREARYVQCFSGSLSAEENMVDSVARIPGGQPPEGSRIEELEARVSNLEQIVAKLEQLVDKGD